MLLKWIDHESFKRSEQLMAILFDCGMATHAQLEAITGWSERNIKRQLQKLYAQNIENEPWLLSYRLANPHQSSGSEIESRWAYTLGPSGMQYVQAMREEDGKPRESPFAQAMHFIGTNEILVRCLQRFDRQAVQWYSTQETADNLYLAWRAAVDAKSDRRQFIRPDAKLFVHGSPFYIEFDNDTEGARKLERKFHSYVSTLVPIKDKAPVIWVAPSEKRRDYLRRNWEALIRLSYSNSDIVVPVMHFFVAGEETEFLFQTTKKNQADSLSLR